jgi:hypothetical protein
VCLLLVGADPVPPFDSSAQPPQSSVFRSIGLVLGISSECQVTVSVTKGFCGSELCAVVIVSRLNIPVACVTLEGWHSHFSEYNAGPKTKHQQHKCFAQHSKGGITSVLQVKVFVYPTVQSQIKQNKTGNSG